MFLLPVRPINANPYNLSIDGIELAATCTELGGLSHSARCRCPGKEKYNQITIASIIDKAHLFTILTCSGKIREGFSLPNTHSYFSSRISRSLRPGGPL